MNSLAYRPAPFFHLNMLIATYCLDEEMIASPAEFVENEGRYYLRFTLGNCPLSSGQPMLFAYDEANDEYLLWDTDLLTSHPQSDVEIAENFDPQRFADIQSLDRMVRYGY
jgi:hypothetical protein